MPSEPRIAPIALVLLCLAGMGVPSQAQTRPAPQTTAPAPDDALFERVLALNRVQEPELEAPRAREAFAALLDRIRPALDQAKTPKEKISVLNRQLLADREVAYLSNLYWRDATLAASLLRGKGNCLSTSTLYVLAGRALQLPIRAVFIPGHAFVRWDDGQTRINIETTAGGREIPDARYREQAKHPTEADAQALGWFRSLDDDAFLGELTMVSAGHRLGEANLEEALVLIEQALKLAPKRVDWELQRAKVLSDITGRRDEARLKISEIAAKPGVPPTVVTEALTFLAAEAAGRGDHETERHYLLEAFSAAPKSAQLSVLQQLAFCHRALKDFRGAVRYMELAVALVDPADPNMANVLYNLSILQKNDKRLDDALASIRKARRINPESWNLQTIEAGYLVLNGQQEAGYKLFETVKPPRADRQFYEVMVAWFYAVSRQREKFYPAFETALANSRNTHILEWIDQDVDLDLYREEPDFKALVAKHKERLLGAKP